ncbi:MAG: GHKL domain-containing protein [Deltaproteobacteria bacterium]|nr:GHKL domain-containing protein [Deltaproteobacteria bacterium]
MSGTRDEVALLKEELSRARDEVYQMAKLAEMGKLVAIVAHELSQPLLGIKAFAQILRRRFEDDDFIEPKVKMIEEQAIHMESILDTLRQYSKSSRFESRTVDPLVPVQAAMELFKERAKKNRIKIILDVKEETLPHVQGNRGHLQQVIVNLLSNALDELEEIKSGSVLIKLQPVENGIQLRLVDSGRGIPEQARDKLFEPFFTTKQGEKGTGLGLSICQDILKSYGGDIRVMDPAETEQIFGPGFGAAFEVFLARAVDTSE